MTIFEKYTRYTSRLPKLEQVCFNLGNLTMIYGGVLTELGNPIKGGAVFVVSACLSIASTGTQEARQALDETTNGVV